MRFDLQHPNEYIRGNTLRFVCKLRDAELVEPLLQPARQCLEHRHAYVRKNAVFAIASIYTHLESLIPDAPELLLNFLAEESDHTCKRNAFAALVSISHDKALEYLGGVFDGIPNADELLQLAELEFIRKDSVANPQNKVRQFVSASQNHGANCRQARYLRLIFDLLESNTSTVVYEAASSLTALTSNPVAVKAAASKFIELSIKEPDNNVKLIVLEKVDQLRQKNEGILDDLTLEILRVLSSPDIDVRKKALELAMEMVSSKNVEEVVMLLKKELSKTVDEQYEKVYKVVKTILGFKLTIPRTPSTVRCLFTPFTNAPSSFPRLPPASLAPSWISSPTSTTLQPWTSSRLSRKLWRSSPTSGQPSSNVWCLL